MSNDFPITCGLAFLPYLQFLMALTNLAAVLCGDSANFFFRNMISYTEVISRWWR